MEQLTIKKPLAIAMPFNLNEKELKLKELMASPVKVRFLVTGYKRSHLFTVYLFIFIEVFLLLIHYTV